MRLLRIQSVLETEPILDDFVATYPKYAILSHTWGREEFLYEDIKNKTGKEKEGYQKIRKCCEVAAADGYEYVWIDTCCIDKTSSAELSEAINSMFKWYMESDVCYAHLFDIDVSSGPEKLVSTEQLRDSRWLTRGWTLQELIAPDTVRFFSSDWTECGNRNTLAISLYRVTNIDPEILQRLPGADERTWLYSLSISKRMSWAAMRQTSRPEDAAYCLLGLFNVNMAMLYGEGGSRAFYRLQEEIMKYSTDQTILAWSPSEQDWTKTMSILADSPAAFRDGSRMLPIEEEREHFEMTSRGLRIAPRLYDSAEVLSKSDEQAQGLKIVMLSCIYVDDPSGQLGINIIRMEGKHTLGSDFARIMQCPVIIPLKHLLMGAASSNPDRLLVGLGDKLQLPPMDRKGRAEDQVKGYVDEAWPLIERRLGSIQSYLRERDADRIYIAHIASRTQERDEGDAYCYFPPITVLDDQFGRKFSLTYPLGSSHTDTVESQTVKIGSTQKQLEVHLTEPEKITGPNTSLCRAVLSRSEDDISLLEISHIKCQCGSSCQDEQVYAGSLRSLVCSGCCIFVRMSVSRERISGRDYNVVGTLVQVFGDPRKPPSEPKKKGSGKIRALLSRKIT